VTDCTSCVLFISSKSDCVVGMPLDSRMMVVRNYLHISNVKKADMQMLQCNASNIHGYLLANTYLNVQGNAAVFFAVIHVK